jgi:hypothetical protein
MRLSAGTDPCNIPAWPCKAGNQLVLDRVGHGYRDDENETGRLFGWAGSRRTQCDNDINLAFNQFNSELAESI